MYFLRSRSATSLAICSVIVQYSSAITTLDLRYRRRGLHLLDCLLDRYKLLLWCWSCRIHIDELVSSIACGYLDQWNYLFLPDFGICSYNESCKITIPVELNVHSFAQFNFSCCCGHSHYADPNVTSHVLSSRACKINCNSRIEYINFRYKFRFQY